MVYSVARLPVSVIIPCWNARRYLPACIAALRSQLAAHDEIILVDNGSPRGVVSAWARCYAPDVHLLTLPVNRGFAGGTNAGIRVARGELLLLCNDDALVEPGCVDALWDALYQYPDVGSVAGVLTYSTHPDIIASAGIAMHRTGVAIDALLNQPVAALPAHPREVFGPSGGLVLLRRTLLDDVGLFEEGFFAYLEDADLAWRARLRGWHSVLAPAARARHVCSASGSGFKRRLLARNRVRVLVRCVPTSLLLACLPAMLGYDMLAVAYAVLRRQPAIAAGRVDALHELPVLFAQRRDIQARRTVPVGELARWLGA